MKHVPNALTLLRLALAPIVAWLMWSAFTPQVISDGTLFGGIRERIAEIANTMTLAAVLFVIAALTDLFDGMIARAFNAHSKFGRVIDPIADKALVGLPLIVIAVFAWSHLFIVIPIAVIISRDVIMTVARLASSDGEGVRVSSLAKWKTAIELIVVGAFLAGLSAMFHMSANAITAEGASWKLWASVASYVWVGLLVLAAALSAYTAWQYLRPSKPAS
jgi:CDP-diacylglycerol--glycerol-3-phosphate 3-phosphatidyltransferase